MPNRVVLTPNVVEYKRLSETLGLNYKENKELELELYHKHPGYAIISPEGVSELTDPVMQMS